MPTPNSLPIPNAAFVDPQSGRLTREGTRFLFSLNRNTSEAASGEVSTPPGSGLDGGGFVADGVTLSIAPNGIENSMLRNSIGTSVIGRFQNSSGDPGDIQAVANDRVLARQGNQLVFTNFLENLVSLQAGLVQCDELRIDQAPVAETVACTHTAVINLNGVDYKFPCLLA